MEQLPYKCCHLAQEELQVQQFYTQQSEQAGLE